MPRPSPLAYASKIVTVQQEVPTAVCLGTQLGTYASSLAGVTCNTNCSAGKESGNTYCGTSMGTSTACCSRPSMFWSALPYADSTPGTNIRAYPFISLPVMVGAVAQLSAIGFDGGHKLTRCSLGLLHAPRVHCRIYRRTPPCA